MCEKIHVIKLNILNIDILRRLIFHVFKIFSIKKGVLLFFIKLITMNDIMYVDRR